ncbi:hypothetical protein ACFPMF_25105 [Larkinella bovis]|uniref:Aerotolerance regulator N-terminal domain-containing protein n=1 Tax=Larkinella bovis TaxID=683041 RepID=A0ABW0IIM4_9BACT
MTVFNHFLFSFRSSDPLHWMLAILLVALLFIQVWLIVGNRGISRRRKWIRGFLNVGLWLVLVSYFLRLEWNVPHRSKAVLIADPDVPSGFLNELNDSLRLERMVRATAFQSSTFRKQLVDGSIDSVTLVGSGFSPDALAQLSRQTVRWIPYSPPDRIQFWQWKGIVRKGDLQTVRGSIQSSHSQRLKLRFGEQTLDSLTIPMGYSTFQLQFPVFSQGRTEVELVLDQKPLDTLRFFARKPEPVTYQFLLDYPDFESKTLADWLGKKGNSVQLISRVSRDISNRVQINRAAAPDVLITDPGNVTNPAVKKAVAQGKPVLLINSSDPEADSKTLNQALGTRWRVKKIANEATVSVGNGLQALPFQFVEAPNQFAVWGYPVAVQKTTANIGFSLLSETYPLKLSGDTLAYDRIWTAILAELQPGYTNNVQVDAPVFAGLRTVVRFNNLMAKPPSVRLGQEPIRLTYSAINELSAELSYTFGRSGWQSLQDSLEIYVDSPGRKTSYGNPLLGAYMRARSIETEVAKAAVLRSLSVQIPDWGWFLLFLGCLTLLWLEPKFSI